ncbi:uncharacterized protein ACMZJ9_017294 [Mantella aurantiaca]
MRMMKTVVLPGPKDVDISYVACSMVPLVKLKNELIYPGCDQASITKYYEDDEEWYIIVLSSPIDDDISYEDFIHVSLVRGKGVVGGSHQRYKEDQQPGNSQRTHGEEETSYRTQEIRGKGVFTTTMSFNDYFTDSSVAAARDSVQADGSFNFTIYLQKCQLTGRSLRFAARFFKVLDLNRNGSLSKRELGFMTFADFLSDQSIAAARQSVTADNSFDYTTFLQKSGVTGKSQTAARDILLIFDINKDGKIDDNEMTVADTATELLGSLGII